MSMQFDIIVVGSYSIDFLFSGMDEAPQFGKDILSKEFLKTPGEAFISAVSLHRLGFKVGWAADFGNDEYSQLALKYSKEEGLDESLFVFHDRPYKRISIAFSGPEERGFITYYDTDPQIPAAIFALTRSRAQILFIPGLYSGSFLQQGLKLARLKKMKFVMDGNSSDGNIFGKSDQSSAIRKAISSTDIFLPNATEARRLTGSSDLADAAQQLGKICPLVVIKDGGNGSIACEKNNLTHVPGIPVESIDTTGAGDNFNSGFLRAWFDGEPIENCLKWGNITGGLATTSLGGTTRKVTRETIQEYYNRFYTS